MDGKGMPFEINKFFIHSSKFPCKKLIWFYPQRLGPYQLYIIVEWNNLHKWPKIHGFHWGEITLLIEITESLFITGSYKAHLIGMKWYKD